MTSIDSMLFADTVVSSKHLSEARELFKVEEIRFSFITIESVSGQLSCDVTNPDQAYQDINCSLLYLQLKYIPSINNSPC
ncbi:unnamed protein product [Clavelina lepadiformis]|uniref:Uncharacterized protein n=1 Tax=Clavelina lepadiformis TaxID=159417 RepID=A0ABP0FRC7_CLALP